MQQNKYRGVVQQTLIDQPISNFMNANCKAPFSDALFRFTVKARNQCLMTNFMRKLIFHDETEYVAFAEKTDKIQFIIF
jgi:hypothetical protein